MAIESVLFSLFLEAPALAAGKFLERRFGWPTPRAELVVIAFLASISAGLCFMAWFLYERS